MIGFVENTLKRELPLPEPKPVVKRPNVVEKPKIEIVEKPKPVDKVRGIEDYQEEEEKEQAVNPDAPESKK